MALPGCFSDKGPQEDPSGDSSTGSTGSTGDPTEATGDPALLALCSDSFERRDAITTARCQCQVDQGMHADLAACLAASGGLMATDPCTCDVYATSPDTQAGLECTAGPQMTLLACLVGVTCTADTAKFDACINPYYTAISTCAGPPRAVQSRVALECAMVPPFACTSGETIPETWTCDAKVDCMDSSDEKTCDGTFVCADGKQTVDAEFKCDGLEDCDDSSDELMCPTFTCTNGVVIPLAYRCDGYADDCCAESSDPACMDKSDELNCPMFMCANGMSIVEALKCNGDSDCTDGSDELACP